MSDEYPIKATLKAGGGYEAPWLTVDATDPLDLKAKLQGLADTGTFGSLVEAANTLRATNNAAPLLPQGQEAQPQQQQPSAPQGWGQQPQQTQQRPQGGGNRQGGQQHPEGKACHCGNVLEMKTTQNGKKKWQCPDWRWNNGNPNGHDMEWVNGR